MTPAGSPSRAVALLSRAVPLLATATFVLAWELLARTDLLPGALFSAPSAVLASLVELAASGELFEHLRATFSRMIPGLLLGAVPGFGLGLGMGWSNTLRRAVDPILMAVHPVPKIAILPLLMIFLGVGEASRVAVASVAAFFPVLINTMAGVRQINPIYFEVANNYGAGRLKLFTRVVIPGSLPLAMSGLRLAANASLLVTISAEIVMSETGLGALVWLAWESLQTEILYATLLVISVLGISISAGLARAQRRLVSWQGS